MAAEVLFHTTVWSEIARAKARSTAALNALLSGYRPPVLSYLRGKGLQEADAEDVAQEVFARILADDLLRKADRERGRFRGLLLGITRNVLREHARRLRAQKRGGGRREVRLHEALAALPDTGADAADDRRFDEAWVRHLIDEALDRLRRRDDPAEARSIAVLEARAGEGASYADLAARFGITLDGVKNHLHRARRRLAAEVRERVRTYCSSPEEFAAELDSVSAWLRGVKPIEQ